MRAARLAAGSLFLLCALARRLCLSRLSFYLTGSGYSEHLWANPPPGAYNDASWLPRIRCTECGYSILSASSKVIVSSECIPLGRRGEIKTREGLTKQGQGGRGQTEARVGGARALAPVHIVSQEEVVDVVDVTNQRRRAVLVKQPHEVPKLPMQVAKNFHGGAQPQYRRLGLESLLRLRCQPRRTRRVKKHAHGEIFRMFMADGNFPGCHKWGEAEARPARFKQQSGEKRWRPDFRLVLLCAPSDTAP